MKKIINVLIICSIMISTVACDLAKKEVSNLDVVQDTSNKDAHVINEDFLRTFENAFPKSEIVCKTITDLDNDKKDDLVIIFNDFKQQTKITKSNICVVTEYGINALDLSGNTLNYQFADGSESLKILQNPTRASVKLIEVKTNKIVDFQVTMTMDKKEKITNFKIESIEQ